MVKPARLGIVGRDDARPRARRTRRRPRPRVPLRRRGDRRALSRRRPGPRGQRHRQRADRLELYGPGEILAGHEFYDYAAKYTPGLSRDDDDRARSRRRTSAAHPQARPRCLPGHRLPRASRASTSCSRGDELVLSEINTIPGFTPISLFPTCPPTGGYDFAAVCRRIIDLALERHAARARHRPRTADLPRVMASAATVRDPGRPGPPWPRPEVAASDRRAATRWRTSPRPSVRASAGLTPVRRGALLALLAPAAAIYGARLATRSSPGTLPSSGATLDRAPAVVRAPRGARGPEPVHAPTDDRSRSALEELPAVAARRGVGRAPRQRSGVGSQEREPLLVWQRRRPALPRRRRRASCSPSSATTRRPAAAALPLVEDRRPASCLARASARRSTRSTSMPRTGSARSRRRMSAAAREACASARRRATASCSHGDGRLDRGLRLLHPDACATTELIPGQVRAAPEPPRRPRAARRDRIILADDRNGTYIPRARPPPAGRQGEACRRPRPRRCRRTP